MRDLHIHIENGEYSENWIEQFVNQATKMGLDEICLVEHSIRFKDFRNCFNEVYDYNRYQKKWVSEKENTMHTLEEFKALATVIRSKSYPVKINFGLEICYFPQHEEEIRQIVSDGFFDYIIGSVHWVDNWTINQRKYLWFGKDVDYVYNRYYELEKMAANSKIFDIIGHPDLITCQNIFPKQSMASNYEELSKIVKENNVMLELNTSRFWKHLQKDAGMNEEFFQIASKTGVTFSTGSDAHYPKDVGKGIEIANQRLLK